MKQYLLGIDIGTSGTKVVIFDTEGNTISSHMEEYNFYQPYIGWAEQNPEDWWKATVKGIKSAIKNSNINSENIKGIGLSGQMHGLVLLDKNNIVLRPSIIWADQRTSKECEEITKRVGKERLIQITANPALTGFTASKIMWVKNNEPEIYDKIRRILLPKDYIRFMLTGEYATEVSDASGMQLLDINKRNWSSEVLEKLEINKEFLAPVYESQVVTGEVSKKVAELTGLKEGTPVVGGAGDQAAGAIGNGIVKSGIVSSTIGTSGVVFAYTNKVTIDPLGRVHTFCHAIPNTWHVMGVTQAAGLSLKWFRDNFYDFEKQMARNKNIDVYEVMAQEASKINPGCEGLIYLPYLMGERTPHLDAYAKGVFFGLTPKHTKSHMIRSIMEGVSYSLKDCMEIIKGLEIEIREVRASGGGSKSSLWRQIQSDMFNSEVVTINSTEGPALGVALLAGVGTGIYSSVQEACDSVIIRENSQKPIIDNYKIYEQYYKIYRRLYLSLKDNFKTISDITNKK